MAKYSKVASNTAMLYIMNIAKIVLSLVTLPYLTRVLSEEAYGLTAYVKSCMTYIQLIIDFGFILSSVKDIVNANGDKIKIGYITGNTFMAKLILSAASAGVMIVMCLSMELLKTNLMFVWLCFLSTVMTAFLADFLFRGIEKMHFITIIYLVTKTISTVLTFIIVKNDASLMWIPVLDIIANSVAIAITLVIINKLDIKIRVSGIKDCFSMIADSFTYFLSNIATTAFSALNTLLIGIYITDLKQVAYWSLCMSMINAVQSMYTPICNGIYPHMVKEKSLKFIHKILLIFMPIVTAGCVFSIIMAKFALYIVGGEKYVEACTLFRLMIPILFFSFPSMLYGWPTLGAIDKAKQTTASTIASAAVQITGLGILIATKHFTVISLAVLRVFTEFSLMFVRMCITYRHKACFK